MGAAPPARADGAAADVAASCKMATSPRIETVLESLLVLKTLARAPRGRAPRSPTASTPNVVALESRSGSSRPPSAGRARRAVLPGLQAYATARDAARRAAAHGGVLGGHRSPTRAAPQAAAVAAVDADADAPAVPTRRRRALRVGLGVQLGTDGEKPLRRTDRSVAIPGPAAVAAFLTNRAQSVGAAMQVLERLVAAASGV